jgi:hypothetical protein
MTYTRCHCRSARGIDTTASGHGQPGIPLLGPPRPAVLGHGEGDLGLQVRLGASRIGLPGGEQFDHPVRECLGMRIGIDERRGWAWAVPPAKPKPPDINTVVASATISRFIADDCAPQRAPVYRQFAQIANLGSG